MNNFEYLQTNFENKIEITADINIFHDREVIVVVLFQSFP